MFITVGEIVFYK